MKSKIDNLIFQLWWLFYRVVYKLNLGKIHHGIDKSIGIEYFEYHWFWQGKMWTNSEKCLNCNHTRKQHYNAEDWLKIWSICLEEFCNCSVVQYKKDDILADKPVVIDKIDESE